MPASAGNAVASLEDRSASPAPTEPAVAATSEPPRQSRDFHTGVNFRTDFGAHYYRVDTGVHVGKLDFILVLDPLGIPKSDYDLDGIVRYSVGSDWSLFTGTRFTMVPIGRGYQYTEKLLVGVSAILPRVVTDRVRIQSGLELAVHVHSHGAGLDSSWVCVDSPSCREDHFVFGLFGRVEYVSPF